MFPIKVVNGSQTFILPEPIVRKKQEQKEKRAKRLSDQELEILAKYSAKGVGTRQISTMAHERNVYVAELAKRRADGICQLCEEPAPFNNKKGEPFLEFHHIIWLSKGGEDTIENSVALCPNCHRKMHVLNFVSDVNKLQSIARINAPYR
jgi:5-methylcytosine-specific restriction protein A